MMSVTESAGFPVVIPVQPGKANSTWQQKATACSIRATSSFDAQPATSEIAQNSALLTWPDISDQGHPGGVGTYC
jgi:hypothetical protein